MQPFVAPSEWAQIQAAIYSIRPRVILEWGSGGSTLGLSRMCERLYSIEHDRAWCARVQQTLPEKSNVELRLIRPLEPEQGVDWAWRQRAEFEPGLLGDYVAAPASMGVEPDVIFVDGRARRFCIREGLRIVRPGGLVILHDAQRRYYHDAIPPSALFLEPWRQGQVCLMRPS